MYESIHQRDTRPQITEVERERALRNLPPSAKLVYKTLDANGALTSKEISDETLLAPRTVRHALKRLRQFGLVNTRASLRDCRTAYFYIGQDCQRV
ncbi:MAG: helix-turn-helix domain-containing protein [Euryarchaeota archaeon]|nr:helix-turn-helix domain-containing protein [Euryarchaeota archaeon]